MKITFYIGSISLGGAERVIVNLANRFADEGHCVSLITSEKKEKEYVLDSKIERVILSNERNKNAFLKNLFYVFQIRKFVKTRQTEVLVSFLAEPNFRAIMACLGTKTKNIVSVRNDPEREYPNLIFQVLAKILYCLASGVVFQTNDAQAWFPMCIRRKSTIIMNQVDDKFYRVNNVKHHRDIVSVGRFFEQKNHELLVKAFSRIAKDIDDNLIIYGDGPLKQKMKLLVDNLELTDRVFLPGMVSDIPGAIENAKLFVLPSNYEGMPNALLEAMALGLACISTDCPCGGPRMVLEHYKNGILIPVGDEEALSREMLFLINNHEIRENLGINAAIKAKSFAPDVVFEEWKRTIEYICGKSKKE